MSDHPWGDDTGATCYECGEVGHFAKNCPYESFDSAAKQPEPPKPTHCPRCGHMLSVAPGHVPDCGKPPTSRLSEWAGKCRELLDEAGPMAGPALHFEALAQQQLAESRAGRLPEWPEVNELTVAEDQGLANVLEAADDFPF